LPSGRITSVLRCGVGRFGALARKSSTVCGASAWRFAIACARSVVLA